MAEEVKLELFLEWLKVNGVELRGCELRYCDSSKGFGIFSSDDVPDGILVAVPLNLAITPMRIVEDPLIGPECRKMFKEGEVDDRFLVMLFLTVERLRKTSSWKPYLDMLPTAFSNPLWFSDDELSELKGTTLYRASEIQRKNLKSLFDVKVKSLVEKILTLDGNTESEVRFEDFLWYEANSIFWSRALNIPLPSSYVFPKAPEEQNTKSNDTPAAIDNVSTKKLTGRDNGEALDSKNSAVPVSGQSSTSEGDTFWVEGLVPGIDFCNHAVKAAATWEIDEVGLTAGIPFSMYLLSAGKEYLQDGQEISINYGNKGNEELLYLYGFVTDGNPDDHVMIHYPMEAISDVSFSEVKVQLLQEQKGELRCLLHRSLLKNGNLTEKESVDNGKEMDSSGDQGKKLSNLNKLVFPEMFLAGLRTVAMKESELYQVTSLLQKVVGSGGEREPSDIEVRNAMREVCGDSGALQMLVDLLNMKMTELEEGSGTEECDAELLKESYNLENSSINRNKRASIVYRHGQKQLTGLFLKEAEHALDLALSGVPLEFAE